MFAINKVFAKTSNTQTCKIKLTEFKFVIQIFMFIPICETEFNRIGTVKIWYIVVLYKFLKPQPLNNDISNKQIRLN